MDNLYKFKAISGVILTVFAYASMFFVSYLSHLESIEIGKSGIEVVKTSDALDAKLKEAREMSSSKTSATVRVSESTDRGSIPSEIDEKLEQIELLGLRQVTATKHTEALEKARYFTTVMIGLLYVVLIIIVFFGMGLMARGFKQWQSEVQLPMDRLLQLQVIEMEKKVGIDKQDEKSENHKN